MKTWFTYKLYIFKYATLNGWDSESKTFEGTFDECLQRLDALDEAEFCQAYISGFAPYLAIEKLVDRDGSWYYKMGLHEAARRRGLLHTPPVVAKWLATNPEQRVAQLFSKEKGKEKGLLTAASEVIEKECPQAGMRCELLAKKALLLIL